MKRLIIILLCGIIASAASAGVFGKRTGEAPKDSAKTSAPAAAVTAAPGRSGSFGYTPSSPSPAPSAQTNSDTRRGGFSFGHSNRPTAPATVYSPSPAPSAQTNSDTRRGGGFSFGHSNRPTAPATVYSPSPAPTAQTNTDTRRGGFSFGHSNRPTAPATVYSPSPAPTTQAPKDAGYRPGTSSRERGNPFSGSVHYSSPAPVTQAPGNAGRRTSGQSGPTGYYPTAPNQESDRRPATADRGRRSGDPSQTPGHGSPGTGYRPGDSSHSQGGSPNNSNHWDNRPSERRNPFNGRTYSTGYRPERTNYTVGYHPTEYSVPHWYKPPTYRQGHYYYSPNYYREPCSYGHWASDYSPGFSYRSIFFNFGIFQYLQVSRISDRSYTSYSYDADPIYESGTYYNNSRYDRLDDALAEIRSGWISGRYDLIQRHVRARQTIAILLDGQYDYSISSDDYLAMTRDAITDLNTVSFVWDNVRERGDGKVTAFGEHAYRSSGQTRTVYVSYTLQKSGRDYFITEVGSSEYQLD